MTTLVVTPQSATRAGAEPERLHGQLLSVMEQEAVLYQALLENLAEETRRLVSNDAKGVLEVSRRKDTIALQIRSLEESRLLIVEKLSRDLPSGAEPPTIAALSGRAAEPLRGALLEVRDRLKTIVENVEAMNSRNRVLAENSLRLLHGSVEALRDQLRPAPATAGYGPSRRGPSQGRGGGIVTARRV
jgi:hypothetical protein